MPSYYEIIGVDPDADADEISEAYAAALREAPTADGGTGARARRLDEAYAVIGEPERRRRYDELRAGQDGGGNPELLALLSVIAETGRLPTAEEVTGPPTDPEPAPPPAPAPAPAPPSTPASAPARPPHAASPPASAPRDTHMPAAEPGPQDGDGEESRASVAAATPRAQSSRHVPGTDVSRRGLGRRRTLVAGALVGLVLGGAAGAIASRDGEQPLAIEEGACVSLAPDEGSAIDCSSPDAEAVVTAVTDDPAGCDPSPAGHLVLQDGRAACLAPR